MSSIGEIKASTPELNEKAKTTLRKKAFYFGVFFDGTGNNMIQPERAKKLRESIEKATDSDLAQDDLDLYKQSLSLSDNGGNPVMEIEENTSDFSNVAVLHSSYISLNNEQRKNKIDEGYDVYCYNIYVEGAGTDEVYTGSFGQKVHNWKGSGFGDGHTGVPKLVEDAMRLVQIRVNGFAISEEDEIHFDVFGFSRGATCARMFSHMIGVHEKLRCESEFAELVGHGKFLRQFNSNKRTVDFLGIYDTVSSQGYVSYDDNTTDYGLYSPNEAWVKMVMHVAALDEYRDHFRLTDIGEAINKDNCIEIFIPGCHSDVGGGYKSGEEKVAIMYAQSRTWKTNVAKHLYRAISGTWSRQIYITDPQTNNGSNIRPVNIETLKLMGWCDDNDKCYWHDRTNGILNITRNIYRGYSNIPLMMMSLRSQKTKRTLFKINEARFVIIDNLLSFHKDRMFALVENKKGRFFYTPPLSDYCQLRRNFIHYSSSDALVSRHTNVVHGPTVHDGTIVRRVYHGDKGSNTVHYMYEYQ